MLCRQVFSLVLKSVDWEHKGLFLSHLIRWKIPWQGLNHIVISASVMITFFALTFSLPDLFCQTQLTRTIHTSLRTMRIEQ